MPAEKRTRLRPGALFYCASVNRMPRRRQSALSLTLIKRCPCAIAVQEPSADAGNQI
jgi:hypothetical protein